MEDDEAGSLESQDDSSDSSQPDTQETAAIISQANSQRRDIIATLIDIIIVLTRDIIIFMTVNIVMVHIVKIRIIMKIVIIIGETTLI